MEKNRIKLEMEKQGISFRMLARKTGVGLNQINSARKGEFERLRVVTLRKIAGGLGIEIRELFETTNGG